MSAATLDPDHAQAIRVSVAALRRMAASTFPPEIDRRMLELGERKEFLGPEEHAELMGLVAYAQERTRERLEAELAISRLTSVFPDAAFGRML